MNRFVVIVMTDSRSDSDAVVSAVSTLGQDKDAEQQAMFSHLASEREYAVATAAEDAASRVREESRRGIGFVKFKAKLEPGETKTITADRWRAFTVTSLQVEAECTEYFLISDIRYAEPGSLTPNKSVDFRASSSPVPAAVFSDEGAAGPVFEFECASAEIVVTNTSKKPRVFRARMLGFHKLGDPGPVPLRRPFPPETPPGPPPESFYPPYGFSPPFIR